MMNEPEYDDSDDASKEGGTEDRKVLTVSDVTSCIEVLEAIAADRAALAEVDLETRQRLLIAAGRVSRPERAEQRMLAKAFRRKERFTDRASDAALLDATGIRTLRRAPVFSTPAPADDTPTGTAPARADSAPAAADSAPARAASARPVTAGEPASATGVSAGRTKSVPGASGGPELRKPRKCYVCKAEFITLHAFYDQLCVPCGDYNFQKRSQKAKLDGRVALITGARVKIGYQAGILLLRSGARVIVTTRFPRDAAARYAREADYEAFKDRLEIYGLDLRHTPSVELFARHLDRHLDRLDFILHNACQTVRRPPGFYAHLMEREAAPLTTLPADARRLLEPYEELCRAGGAPLLTSGAGALFSLPDAGLRQAARLSQAALAPEDAALAGRLDIFPEGKLDQDLQQVDLRTMNSWRLTLADVPTVELIEVHLVNAIAVFVLSARLKPLLLRRASRDKHIVNVSAMEGQFYRDFKTDRHPHTNMAKAALNMMTRTSAADYVKDGIHMNSVDTGWVTDEDPATLAARKQEEHGFHPPLDIVDGAARIVDPIVTGFLTGKHAFGQFFKDYFPTSW